MLSFFRRFRDGSDPIAFVSPFTLLRLAAVFAARRDVLLSARHAREVIASDRAHRLLPALKRSPTNGSVIHNAIDYNIDGARTAAYLDRPMIMTNVVTSIERVNKRLAKLDVLSIGPRSEIEIFGLRGAGFSADRIKALDLFSYSPFIDVGDMHAMPYPDNSFDVVFSGWVFPYSKNHTRAATEMLRICRPGAIVAIANDYSDTGNIAFENENTFIQSCDYVLDLFAGHVGRTYFRHDPELPDYRMVMTVFEITK